MQQLYTQSVGNDSQTVTEFQSQHFFSIQAKKAGSIDKELPEFRSVIPGLASGKVHKNLIQLRGQLLHHYCKTSDVLDINVVLRLAEQRCWGTLPASLCAALVVQNPSSGEKIFHQVVRSLEDVYEFIHTMRHGELGRTSLGSVAKRLIQQWLERLPLQELALHSVLNRQIFRDILLLTHPKPSTSERESLYAVILGRKDNNDLPVPVGLWLNLLHATTPVNDSEITTIVEFLELLPSSTPSFSEAYYRKMMQLPVFYHIGADKEYGVQIVELLAHFPEPIVAPSIMADYWFYLTGRDFRNDPLFERLIQQTACRILPECNSVAVCVDVSGSMRSVVTPEGTENKEDVRCLDYAAILITLLAAASKEVIVVPFEQNVIRYPVIAGSMPFISLIHSLERYNAADTNCSSVIRHLRERQPADLVMLITDNETWSEVDTSPQRGYKFQKLLEEWRLYTLLKPDAKLICLDLLAKKDGLVRVKNDPSVFCIGGFSGVMMQQMSGVMGGHFPST